MNYQDVFTSAPQANLEQTLLLNALEMTSVIIAVVAAVAVIVTIIGVIHLVRAETKQTPRAAAIRPRTAAVAPALHTRSNLPSVRTQQYVRRAAAIR